MDSNDSKLQLEDEVIITVGSEDEQKVTGSPNQSASEPKTEKFRKPEIIVSFGNDEDLDAQAGVGDSTIDDSEQQSEDQPAKESNVKPISDARRAASRANGKLSRGPKTEVGKSRSRYNAVKHGLFANLASLLDTKMGESPRDFPKLLLRLRKDLEPVGAAEDYTVEKIAEGLWKSKRTLRYQLAIVESRLDENAIQLRPCAVSCCAEEIRQAIKELQKQGFISQRLERELITRAKLPNDISTLNAKLRTSVEQGTADVEVHQQLLELLDSARQRAELQEEEIQEQDRQRRRLLRNKLALENSPEFEEMDRRSQSIDKQLDRAYERLFRLQARRKARQAVEVNDDED